MTSLRDKSPKKGERYRALTRVPISGMSIFAAPFTGHFRGYLEEGETLLVETVCGSGAVDLLAGDAEVRKRIEEDFIFPSIASRDEYSHFVVIMPEAELEEGFALVEPTRAPASVVSRPSKRC